MNTAPMRGQACQTPERTDARASLRTCVPISHHDQPLRCQRPRADPHAQPTAIAFSRRRKPRLANFHRLACLPQRQRIHCRASLRDGILGIPRQR